MPLGNVSPNRKQSDGVFVWKPAWILAPQIVHYRTKIGLRLGGSYTKFCPPKYVKSSGYSLRNLTRVEHHRQIYVRTAKHEARRHHSHYGAYLAVQMHPAPNYTGISSKLTLPKFVAQDRNRLRSRSRVIRCDDAAKQRRHAQDLESVHRHVIPAKAAGFAGARPDHVTDSGRGKTLEYRGTSGELEILIDCIVQASTTCGEVPNDNAVQMIDIFVRERIDDHGVNHAVHRRGGADAEGERSGGDQSECGPFCETRVCLHEDPE